MTEVEGAPPKPKRFYKDATVDPVEGKYAIHLDARPVRTPLGNALELPVLPLAKAIVREWLAQGDTIDPASMPLCGFANTAIDRVGADRQTVSATLMNYAETDLLCYRADHPDDLVSRQHESWQPILDWAAASLGVQMQITVGVLPVEQPPESLKALNDRLSRLDDMEFTAVASIAAACGSLILALALAEARIDGEQAFQCSQLDESFQSERWGLDEEAEARQLKLKEDIASAALFLSLLRQ